MFKKFLSVTFIIACAYSLKSFPASTSDKCHGEWVSIDSLNISLFAKKALQNSGVSINELRLWTEEELLWRFNIDRASILEVKGAFKILSLSSSKDPKDPETVFQELGLSVRTARKLIRVNILSPEELTAKTEEELKGRFDIGPETTKEIKEALEAQGQTLSNGKDLNAPGLSPFERFKRLGLSTKTINKLLMGREGVSDNEDLTETEEEEALDQEKILSIEELTAKTEDELKRRFDIGSHAVQEIKKSLKAHGLFLSDGKDLHAPGLSPFDQFKRLGLSTATARKLIRANIFSIKTLTEKTENELKGTFDIGPYSFQQIQEALETHGLSLSAKESFTSPPSWNELSSDISPLPHRAGPYSSETRSEAYKK